METELLKEESRGPEFGGARGAAVHAVLIQSKSIKVKSQVPIQILLEEEGIEPRRSPWKALPPPPADYSSVASCWTDTDALTKDRSSRC